MGIALARVDDRLIHGQIMTSWLNYLGAKKIVVVDDDTANNPMMEMIMRSVVPSNVKIEVMTLETGIEKLKDVGEEKIILLTKYPQTMEKIIEGGVDIKDVNIGGMAKNPGREIVYKFLAASPDEKTCIQRMIQKGVDVGIQIIADDKRINAKDYFM